MRVHIADGELKPTGQPLLQAGKPPLKFVVAPGGLVDGTESRIRAIGSTGEGRPSTASAVPVGQIRVGVEAMPQGGILVADRELEIIASSAGSAGWPDAGKRCESPDRKR